MKKKVEIVCSACGQDAILVRKPRYDGLTRTGESIKCSVCGHEFASEQEVEFKSVQSPRIFTAADKSRKIRIFSEDEKGKLCRYCSHYVVNPFTQRCSLHKKTVEATDTCDRFEPREDNNPESGDDKPRKVEF